MLKYVVIPGLCSLIMSCSAQVKTSVAASQDAIVAFPGAEGFGKFTTGGRGGKVYIITNLNDAGPGSLREAAEAKQTRFIVFAVSGTIHLATKLNIRGNVTIAGQTAPGGGICIADQPVLLGGDNIIIRYLRIRMGDRFQRAGMKAGNGADDALGGSRRKNVIIDHCSLSWSTDEVMSVYGGDSTTLQWNMIAEPLNYSYHFEEGDKDFEKHGYGGIWGGSHLSAHHNLFISCNSRNPRFNGARLGASDELVDFRNNVIYNWGGNNVYGGEGGLYNVVNNYYRYGPSTSQSVRYRIVNPSKQEKPLIPFGKFYVTGNHVDDAPAVTANNDLGIHMGNNATETEKSASIVRTAFDVVSLPDESAGDAYKAVLQGAGALYPERDTMDLRLVNNVRQRTGGFVDVQGGFPHGTAYEATVNAWPALRSVAAARDTDSDGMPDDWELKNNLNPAIDDASGHNLSRAYTNIEIYSESLLKSAK